MTIEMNEFDQLKKKFYEQFAKEYNIQLREADMQAPAADPNMAVNQTPAPAPIQPASTDPVPPIRVAQDIAPGVAADTSLQQRSRYTGTVDSMRSISSISFGISTCPPPGR